MSLSSKVSKAKKVLPKLLVFVFGLLLTYIPYWGLTQGKLIGDLGDARWTISIHESWFLTFKGKLQFGETLFFFPFSDSLGMSDAFFAQAIPYSILRLIGIGPINSWIVPTLILIGISALGYYFIAFKALSSRTASVLAFFIMSSSYNFHSSMAHVQTAGYSLIFLAVGLAIVPKKSQKDILGKMRLPVVIGLVSLTSVTSWYAFVFFLIISFLVLVIGLVIAQTDFKKNLKKWFTQSTNTIGNTLSAIVAILFSALWISIYWSAVTHSPKASWGEYLNYAPRMDDYLNTSRAPNFWSSILDGTGLLPELNTMERALGFPLGLLFAFIYCASWAIYRQTLAKDKQLASVAIFSGAVMLTVLLFTVSYSGFSLYWFAWEYLPGASTIRAPMRATILLMPIMTWVVARSLEASSVFQKTVTSDETKRRKHLSLVALPFLLIIEQQTGAATYWTREEFVTVDTIILAQQLSINECRAFYLKDPSGIEKPWWQAEIDAISAAVYTGYPTANGYSRSGPDGSGFGVHPSSDEGTSLRLAWSRANTNERVCEVVVKTGREFEIIKP